MLDLSFGYEYQAAECLALHPHIGLKGGWINQTQQMEVKGILHKEHTTEFSNGSVKRQNNFKGIGPCIGIDLSIAYGPQFGIFGTLSGAAPVGKFDLKTTSSLDDTFNKEGMAGNGREKTTIENSHNFLSPTFQMLVGGEWNRLFCNKYLVRFGVGYEVQFWWNQIKSNLSVVQALFLNTPAGGDLTLHGLTVQAKIDF